MELTTKTRNMFILGFLVFVLTIFILYTFIYKPTTFESFQNSEYYDCKDIQSIIDHGSFDGNPTNLVPCVPELSPKTDWFRRFNPKKPDGWMESDGRLITYTETIRNGVEKNIQVDRNSNHIIDQSDIKSIHGTPLKTDYMTISFWIYIRESSHHWKPIVQFGTIKNNRWFTDRLPGVWLWPWLRSSLHIRRSLSTAPDDIWQTWHDIDNNAGGDIFTEFLNNIPMKKPTYVSIVFSLRTYKIYINGVHIQTVELNETDKNHTQVNERDDVRKYIWLGSFDNDMTYYLRKFQIFPTPLTDHEVKLLYCTNKEEAMNTHRFNRINFNKDGFRNRNRTNNMVNVFNMKDSYVEWNTDSDSPSLSQQAQQLVQSPSNTNSVEVCQIASNKLCFHSCTLEKLYFPKLHHDKKLEYVTLHADKKEYLQWTKPFDLKNTAGVTFSFWYRPFAVKAYEHDFKKVQDLYKTAKAEMDKNIQKGEPAWQENVWRHTNEAWIPGSKYQQYSSDTSNTHGTRLIDFGTDSDSNNIILYIWDKSISLYVRNKDNRKDDHYSVPMVAEGNHWYHLAIVIEKTPTRKNKTKATWKFYHNGTLHNTLENMNYPADGVRSNQFIGKGQHKELYYTGDIGDFRVYKKALSKQNVQQVMNQLPNAQGHLPFTGFS